jgi:hypothetical protein
MLSLTVNSDAKKRCFMLLVHVYIDKYDNAITSVRN